MPFTLVLSSCSFHSSQLGALTSMFKDENGPKPQWTFSWGSSEEEVFAINAGDTIFFANESGFLVRFNGSFVDRLEKVKFGEEGLINVSISRSKRDGSQVFRYAGKMASYGEVVCGASTETSLRLIVDEIGQEMMEVSQDCIAREQELKQSVILDQSRRLIRLTFFIHPARKPATLSYRLLQALPP